MKVIWIDQSMRQEVIAHRLLADGLRIPFVHSLTGISPIRLRLARKKIAHLAGVSKRPAKSFAGYMMRRNNRPQLSLISSLVLMHLSLMRNVNGKSVSELFLDTWDMREIFIPRGVSIDINALFYAIQETHTKDVPWAQCDKCMGRFLWVSDAHRTVCPYCHHSKVKAVLP